MNGRLRSPSSTASIGPVAHLRVDPVLCDGVGLCALIAPALIAVDAWGYPILSDGPVARRDVRSAKAAVAACPRRALFLVGE